MSNDDLSVKYRESIEGIFEADVKSSSSTFPGNFYPSESDSDDVYLGEQGYLSPQSSSKLWYKDKSIYDLESYTSSIYDYEFDEKEYKRVIRQKQSSESLGISGVYRIYLSPLTQKILGCVIGEHVTTEYPWIYVKKETIEDNLDLHSESSDFLPLQEEIITFEDAKVLIQYAPTKHDEAQFYICVTNEARDAMVQQINSLRLEQENRARNALYKNINYTWEDLGSAEEVDDAIEMLGRPLMELDFEARSLEALIKTRELTDLNTEDNKWGYCELLPYRQEFHNVSKVLVDSTQQIAPCRKDNAAQTYVSILQESACQTSEQQECKFLSLESFTEKQQDNLKKFLNIHVDEMCESLVRNSLWDIHNTDYEKVGTSGKEAAETINETYMEYRNYYEGRICAGKVITDLCWHPTLSGIAITAYSDNADSDITTEPQPIDQKLLKVCQGIHFALVWSLSDHLTPKLILESPREVRSISVCPVDGNIIVGGCANGQIIVWSIAGRIERVEKPDVRTVAQARYKITIKSLMSWLKDPKSKKYVTPTAMSNMNLSQKDCVTQIIWLEPHHAVNKRGNVEKTAVEDASQLSRQFITASLDGTIAFWDLKQPLLPDTDVKKDPRGAPPKKPKVTVKRPTALAEALSPLKVLDSVLKPIYMITLKDPDVDHTMPITAMSLYQSKLKVQELSSMGSKMDDLAVRRHFEPVIELPEWTMKREMMVGTMDGYCALVTWEGYEYSTGLEMNHEKGKLLWRKRLHDGPVSHLSRSKHLHNVVASVGGKALAIWREDFGEPILKKMCDSRYTSCSWETQRPSVLIVARGDGTVEIWNLIVKNHEPVYTQSISGHSITVIHAHELPIEPQCVAFCDYNGAQRVFIAPRTFKSSKDIEWMRNFVDREVQRISDYNERLANRKTTDKEEEDETIQMQKEAMRKEEADQEASGTTGAVIAKAAQAKDTRTFTERMDDRWREIELRRMQRVILDKKGLSEEALNRQRAPVLKIQQDLARKREKMDSAMEQHEQIFRETVSFLFPGQFTSDEFSEAVVAQSTDQQLITKNDKPADPLSALFPGGGGKESIIYAFNEIQAEVLSKVKQSPHKRPFDWQRVVRRRVSAAAAAAASSKDNELKGSKPERTNER